MQSLKKLKNTNTFLSLFRMKDVCLLLDVSHCRIKSSFKFEYLDALKPPPHCISTVVSGTATFSQQVGNQTVTQSSGKSQNDVPAETKGRLSALGGELGADGAGPACLGAHIPSLSVPPCDQHQSSESDEGVSPPATENPSREVRQA